MRLIIALVVLGAVAGAAGWYLAVGRVPDSAAQTGTDSDYLAGAVGSSAAGVASAGGMLDPEHGRWPGLPHPAGVQPVDTVPLSDAVFEELPLARLAETPLLQRVESYSALAPDQRLEHAVRIVRAWEICQSHRLQSEDEMRAVARQKYEDRKRVVIAELAEHDNPKEVDEAIGEIAEFDFDGRLDAWVADEMLRQRLCAGVEEIGYDQRELRRLRWLEIAAELGHRKSRVSLTLFGLSSPDIRPGNAEILVQRKQRVAAWVLELLQQRDIGGLEAAAFIAKEGFYRAPDPFWGHVYYQAALNVIQGAPGATAWHSVALPDEEQRRPGWWLEFNLRLTAAKLSPDRIAEAEKMARRLLEVSR